VWIWYVLLGVLAVLLLVLLTPICGRITYDGALRVRVRIWGIPFTVYPVPQWLKSKIQSRKNTKKTAKKASTSSSSQPAEPKPDKPSKVQELVELLKQDDLAAVLSYLQELAEILTHTATRLLRGVTMHRLELQMLVATDDVAETAQKYGKVCGIVYPAVAAIEGVVRVRRRRLRIEPNFLLEKSAVRFDISIGMTVWRMLVAGVPLLWNILLLLSKIEPQKNKEVVSDEK
jgi:hypothetical protein